MSDIKIVKPGTLEALEEHILELLKPEELTIEQVEKLLMVLNLLTTHRGRKITALTKVRTAGESDDVVKILADKMRHIGPFSLQLIGMIGQVVSQAPPFNDLVQADHVGQGFGFLANYWTSVNQADQLPDSNRNTALLNRDQDERTQKQTGDGELAQAKDKLNQYIQQRHQAAAEMLRN